MEIMQFVDDLCYLMRHYLLRQRIAYHAMVDLRPDILLRATRNVSIEHILDSVSTDLPRSQEGLWGDKKQWQYFFHGLGCRLQHSITNEPIQWDAPDTDVFDVYWFIEYVQWWIKQAHQRDQTLWLLEIKRFSDTGVEETILSIVDALKQKGILQQASPNNPNKLRLIET